MDQKARTPTFPLSRMAPALILMEYRFLELSTDFRSLVVESYSNVTAITNYATATAPVQSFYMYGFSGRVHVPIRMHGI